MKDICFNTGQACPTVWDTDKKQQLSPAKPLPFQGLRCLSARVTRPAAAAPVPFIPFLDRRSVGCNSAPQRVAGCRRRLTLLFQLHRTQLQLHHQLGDPLAFNSDELVQYTGRAASGHVAWSCATAGPAKIKYATRIMPSGVTFWL